MSKRLRWASALVVIAALAAPAEAKIFRWANDGDANSISTLGRGRPSWGAGPPPSL
jgi:hypothetical protein